MLEWYDFRLIDLYPDDRKGPTPATPSPVAIVEPREEVADDASLHGERRDGGVTSVPPGPRLCPRGRR
jgi:hypothetical protein